MTSDVQTIDAAKAASMVAAGATLVDIRAPDEHASERIAGALNRPLASLARVESAGPVIFHCRSGNRTAVNALRLRQACDADVFILGGGIDAWKASGLPVVVEKGRPLDIMRQVQIIGGSLVLVTIALGWLVAPAYLLLGAAVGAGMVHAGVTGSCAMARLLAPLPWNRRAVA